MNAHTMKGELDHFLEALEREELSMRTRKKYRRDILFFLDSLGGEAEIGKMDVISYREFLMEQYRFTTANSYLISVNRYFGWLGCSELAVKTLRIQRGTGLENVISPAEYQRLLDHCLARGKRRNYLILRVIAGTGIRVGELEHITREAASHGSTVLLSKRKCRSIFIPDSLTGPLLRYCDEVGIRSGPIFLGRQGRPLGPSGIWKLLKRLAQEAGVDADKVYPHSLRHLFAKTYMQRVGNVFELADLLGHSSIETTRVYALTSYAEKKKSVDELGL